VFVDQAIITVQAGNGGDGCLSFYRAKYLPKGGPDGGDGGNGGSVFAEADPHTSTLLDFRGTHHWTARNGQPGRGSQQYGAYADDLVIRVPPGTLIYDDKTSELIADVGLIGKPNAGKSTLLSRLSHARPEIADYPFTTKHPNLGRVQIDFDRSFVMADIPGLIEGAHDGVGLGHEFLRHVERAGILIHLVEPCPADGSDPVENHRVIREELALHSAELAKRPEIIVVTKVELPGADEVREQLDAACGGEGDNGVLAISAVTGQGLDRLIGAISRRLWPSEND